jgi:hypothetical protein
MGKFGDIDRQKEIANVTARIKAALMLLFQMFAGPRASTSRKLQNFIPHLRRTDRDCGSLPFFSKDYHTQKTNKEHVLLTIASKVVQEFWRFVSPTAEMSKTDAKIFLGYVALLEAVAKDGFDKFQVYGTFPKFTLMSKANIDAIELEDAKKERAAAAAQEEKEQQTAEDAVEAKNLMNAVLDGDTSGSVQSSSTDAAETELGEQSGSQSDDAENTDDSDDDTKEESGDSSSETEAVPPVKPIALIGDGNSTDQVSVEDADACVGDCDDCDNAACQANETAEVSVETATGETEESLSEPRGIGMSDDAPEREDNIAGAVVGGEPCCLDCEMEDQRKTEEADADSSDAADEAEVDKTPPPPPAPPEEKIETD